MGKNWCLNGTMVDTGKYASPVPFVGLYTAAATLVCLILILCDLGNGFRRRKSWLPCGYFSLSSVTLTLISVASKLPVDLTTPMPSAQDQLSKLTGTVFICMSMGFLMPSLGIFGEIESYSNLVALSIFVVTVVVNICIQMATGVIFSFVVEHSIILFSMLVLLVMLWAFAFDIIGYKGVSVDRNREFITKGSEGSMLQRLKVCYLHGYSSCPQLGLHRFPHFGTLSLISTICSAVLVEALFRSIVFKDIRFCKGSSDYEWSMPILVGTQVITVVVINFAIGCRWLTLAGDVNWINTRRKHRPHRHPNLSYLRTAYPFYMRNSPKWLYLSFMYIYNFMVRPINKLVARLVNLVSQALGWLMQNTIGIRENEDRSIEEHKALLQTNNFRVRDWTLRKGLKDMERWMELSSSESTLHLRKLLSTKNPSRESLKEELVWRFYSKARSEVSCLSILILAELAKMSMPNSITTSLMEDTLDEIFEIIYFIDSKMNTRNFCNKIKSMSAEVLWKGKTTGGILHHKKVRKSTDGMLQSPSELDHTLGLITDFHHLFAVDVVRDEVCCIVNLIQHRSCTSVEQLSNKIKLLFVNMLHALLSQLPKAIFNHIVESPVEEYEERVRLGLKFVCKLELLESYVGWSFPIGSNITSLITAPVSATVAGNNLTFEGNVVSFVDPVMEDTGEIQSFQHDDNV